MMKKRHFIISIEFWKSIPYDVETLSLKLRVHQYLAEKEDNQELKQNELDVVIDCCRKILDVAPDNFEVRDLITELES